MDLRLEGRAALVAGGGAVAHRKVRGLLAAGAAVTVVAPKLSPPLAALAADGRIAWLAQLATAEVFASLPRALLVFCATDDRAANAAFGKAAKEAGALVNDATTPGLCDFFLPAALRAPRHGIDGRRIARARPHAEEAARRPPGRELGRLARKARRAARRSEGTHRRKCRT